MSRRRAAALVLLCIVPSLWISTIATARPPSEIRQLGPADFRPIVLPADPTGAVAGARDVASGVPSSSAAPIRDFPIPSRQVTGRPRIDLPTTVEAEAKPVRHPKLTGHRVAGSSTWYCQTGVSACHHAYPGGMYAAAGSELRVGAWRGRQVRVCAGQDCIWVRLIDTCACGGARVIDLYSDAFRRLAPLNAGVLRVTVSW